MKLFFLLLVISFQGESVINALSGKDINLNEIITSEEYIVYIMDSGPCQQCAHDLFNYSVYEETINLPPILFITEMDRNQILDDIKANKESGTYKMFNRTHFFIPVETKSKLLSHLEIDANNRIYYVQNGIGRVIEDELMIFIQDNFR